ncbi:MAG: hypothetical protein NTY53_08320 [Kiritimatiellaeota bacterium]|nr:hypothetical protein [Kiritimatiellota bacterium]
MNNIQHRMKRALLIIGAILLVGMILFMAVVPLAQACHRNAKLCGQESSQRALVAEACRLLEDYRYKNGKFPEALAVLPLTYPDGGSTNLPKDISYTCLGTGYILRTVGYLSGESIEFSR